MIFLRYSVLGVVIGLGASLLAAQTPPPAAPDSPGYSPDDVVAVIEGKEYTAKDIEWLRKNMPPDLLKQTANMNYAGFLESLAMQISLAERAEKMKLAEKEPYRTRLEINERIFLANAFLSEVQQVLHLTQDDYRQFYDDHKSDFEELRVSAIYIDYATDPSKAVPQDGKKVLNETEAWGKAEKLLADMRQGTDFAQLAKENSDDPASAEKGGDLGYFKKDARIPEVLKKVIFALKEGELSTPVKQGGRYYIFKVTERHALPYTDALPYISQRIQDVKIKEKLDEIRAETNLEIKNQAFANSKPGMAAESDSATTPAPAPKAPAH